MGMELKEFSFCGTCVQVSVTRWSVRAYRYFEMVLFVFSELWALSTSHCASSLWPKSKVYGIGNEICRCD